MDTIDRRKLNTINLLVDRGHQFLEERKSIEASNSCRRSGLGIGQAGEVARDAFNGSV